MEILIVCVLYQSYGVYDIFSFIFHLYDNVWLLWLLHPSHDIMWLVSSYELYHPVHHMSSCDIVSSTTWHHVTVSSTTWHHVTVIHHMTSCEYCVIHHMASCEYCVIYHMTCDLCHLSHDIMWVLCHHVTRYGITLVNHRSGMWNMVLCLSEATRLSWV